MWFRRQRTKGVGNIAAQKAFDDASLNLRKVESRGPEIHELSNSLKLIRERNHFSEKLQLIITGDGGDPLG